jgi:hypothetical protein
MLRQQPPVRTSPDHSRREPGGGSGQAVPITTPRDVIEWRSPRLICIAGDFTKYDQHAIGQMPRNIDLIRYRRYGDDLLLLEQIATHSVESSIPKPTPPYSGGGSPDPRELNEKPLALQRLESCSPEVVEWYHQMRAFALGLADNVHEHVIDRYITFRALTNLHISDSVLR